MRRDVFVPDLMMHMRAMLGLPPEEQAPGEETAVAGVVPDGPKVVVNIACGEWLAWVRVGLWLFSAESLPSSRLVLAETWRLLLAQARSRYAGNITHMATAMGRSRRSVRERLKSAGLYEPKLVDSASTESADDDE